MAKKRKGKTLTVSSSIVYLYSVFASHADLPMCWPEEEQSDMQVAWECLEVARKALEAAKDCPGKIRALCSIGHRRFTYN